MQHASLDCKFATEILGISLSLDLKFFNSNFQLMFIIAVILLIELHKVFA